ncbi:hypothetical protein, partial [Stenotrophomonas sp. YIM B13575]|uniref:hypothetical protein n=1 Tax=Stenotrophomonas sp. YIM B13575 TaxID=3366314 RepID=UPI003673ABBD
DAGAVEHVCRAEPMLGSAGESTAAEHGLGSTGAAEPPKFLICAGKITVKAGGKRPRVVESSG